MATTPIDKLSETIASELRDYADGVSTSLIDATKKITKAGVKALRADAKTKFKGNTYWKGWTSTYETGKRSAQGIIYNKDVPGLAHLLEHGHAKRNGGRVPGTPNIEPVEETIAQEFTAEVEKNL